MFVVGIALAHYADEIKARLAKSPLWIWLGLEIACYLLFDAPWGRSPLWLQPFQFGLAGAMVIALVCASARAARILSNAFFGWLGRISYSLYLLHLLVLGTAVQILGPAFGRSAALLSAFIASFVVAHVSYLVLERPCVNLGRRLTKRDPIEPSRRSALSAVPATAGSPRSASAN